MAEFPRWGGTAKHPRALQLHQPRVTLYERGGAIVPRPPISSFKIAFLARPRFFPQLLELLFCAVQKTFKPEYRVGISDAYRDLRKTGLRDASSPPAGQALVRRRNFRLRQLRSRRILRSSP